MKVNFCYKILPLKNAGIPLVILKQVKKISTCSRIKKVFKDFRCTIPLSLS